MFNKKINNFISEPDKFLKKFDRQHPEKSASQQAEIAKHEHLAKLRDEQQSTNEQEEIWQDF